jgi:hypothetical protein
LLHVVVSLRDICGALESNNGVATVARYKEWCRRYSPQDYWEIRNRVLHQGRTKTAAGRVYKFTRVHRAVWAPDDVVALDVG